MRISLIQKFISLIILTIFVLSAFSFPKEAGAFSDEFNNAATVAQTFKKIYGDINYSTLDRKPFDQGFIDRCNNELGIGGCQSLVRVVAAAAISHAFLYKLENNQQDLGKATYLIQKLIDNYNVWKSTNDVWVLNAIAVYNFGLASWTIWDELNNEIRTSVKDIIITEANHYLTRKPFPTREDWGRWGWDTKAEENAAVPALMVMATNFFPEEPNANQWENQARCFAYHSITIGKDEPFCGVKTITTFDNSDSVGVSRPSTNHFYLDYDGDQYWTSNDFIDLDHDGDKNEPALVITETPPTSNTFNIEELEREYHFGLSTDLPVAGDWDGNGLSEVGVYRPSSNIFYLDNGDGVWNTGVDIISSTFGMAGDVPIIGDWNGDGRDEVGIFRIDSNGIGLFALDWNGNRKWDGSTIDKVVYFGQSGDMPVAGKWNNSQRSYVGVYRPSNSSFYIDWDGSYSWDASIDKSFYFKPDDGSTGFIPVIGDWNDDGKDEIGLFGSKNDFGFFYLDFNNDFSWSLPNDISFQFGRPGDRPVSGRWLKREPFWMVNHFIRPHVAYMSAEPLVFLDSYLVYKKAGKNMPTEFLHNVDSLWNELKKYINIQDFSWTIKDDRRSTGITEVPGVLTYMCRVFNKDCSLENQMLYFKANDTQASSFIERVVTKQTEFIFTEDFIFNSFITKRYIITALSHDPSLLPSLPLKLIVPDNNPPSAITNLSIFNTTQTSVNLAWSSPGDDGNSGIAASYDIRYSTTPLSGTSWSSAIQVTGEPTPQSAGTNQSMSIVGLSPNMTYYFAIKTVDEVPNWSSLSNVLLAKTLLNICTSFTYSDWSACQPNNTQSRTVISSSPQGCTGGNPILTQSCTYTPPTCTSFTYSNWSACQPNNTQIRTIVSQSPQNCTRGNPILTQSCTHISTLPICESFTYSGWCTCQPDNTQTRTIISQLPQGCDGGNLILSQSCVYTPPICTSFTYSDWSACQPNNTQSRTVATQSPLGCTGGNLILSQSCVYTPPSSGGGGGASSSVGQTGVGISAPTTPSMPSSNLILTDPIYIKKYSEQAKILQTMLSQDPQIYPEGEITGYYGNKTIQAVQKFQCKYSIVCSGTPQTTGYGMAGPATRKKLNEIYGNLPALQPKITGTDKNLLVNQIKTQIAALQQKLVQLLTQLAELLKQQKLNH